MTLELAASVDARDVDVQLSVAAGETLAILGPNGSGKSTILALIAGLLRPNRGSVRLDERVLTRAGDGQQVFVPPHARQVAMLAQDPLLFPHLSLLENVAFAPRARGVRRAEARQAAQRWLDQIGIGELAARTPSEVSGGQAQRAAVARALAADPRLLLLDEPMAALDVAVTPALRQTLRRMLTGRTAILITHDPLDALLLADKVVVVEGGRVVERGAAADVLARPRSDFAARLAGLNMVRGSWRERQVVADDGTVVHGMVSGSEPAPGDQVVAVFSPSAVALYRADPGGSPRNAIHGTVREIEPRGDRVRVLVDRLRAEVTPQALAELDLVPGTPVTLSVKATEVSVYQA